MNQPNSIITTSISLNQATAPSRSRLIVAAMSRARQQAVSGILTLLVFCSLALAHGGMEHVQGKVAKVSDNSITVTTTAGKTQEVLVDSKTTYSKASKPIQKADIQVGDRVVVHAEEVNEKLTARTVEIGPAAKTTAKAAPKTATKPAPAK